MCSSRAPDPKLTPHVTEVSAQHARDLIEMTGALVVGRTLFDMTAGWDGSTHPQPNDPAAGS